MPILKVKNKTTGLWEDIPYIKGEKGEKGDTGERGPQGVQGEQGIQGIQGDQGIPGVQGPIGLTGPQGVQGEKGEKGDTGAVPIFTVGSTTTLPPGSAPSINIDSTDPENPVMEIGIPKGDTGAKGDKGDKGDTGDTGPAPSFTVGTTSSLPAGSAPVITIDSSDPAHLVMDFGIPAGAKGDKGDKGDTGAAGQDGADGADGTDGQDGISPTITVTSISGGHEVEVVDASGTQTFDVMDGEVSEEELTEKLADKADVITSTASGEIVTIADGGDDMPVVDLSVSLVPVQDLHGQDAPYPPGGGKNLLNVVSETAVDWYTSGYSGYSVLDGGIVQITGTALFGFKVPCSPSTQYTVSYTSSETYTGLRVVEYASEPDYIRNTDTFIVNSNVTSATFTTSATATWLVVGFYATTQRTLSKIQLEKGSSATSYAPFSNVCPISGWTGVDVYQSGADTSNPTTYPITWQSSAGTVYGGSLDLTTGVLTVTHGFNDLGTRTWTHYAQDDKNYFYTSLSPTVKGVAIRLIPNDVCEMYASKAYPTVCGDNPLTGFTIASSTRLMYVHDDRYNDSDATTFKNAMSGVHIAYELKEPIVYQLSETQIATLLGTNNFWSNSNGSIDLEYRADTKLYIEQLTKPSEDDMVANSNITSGSFFMVGNRLFLSSVAIGQGQAIVPGTNCTEISLADALNSLNS